MTEPPGPGDAPGPPSEGWPPQPQPSAPWPPQPSEAVRGELAFAGLLILAMAVLGALLGAVWAWWSGPQQRAYVIAPGKLYPFDEVETMIGADGRYCAIVLVVGLVIPLVVWLRWRDRRGPLASLSLAVGGLAGAALTAWVGHLTDGGSSSGKTNTIIAHLPLTLHMDGLLFVEPGVAVLLYGLLVAFTVRDDLGRPDPVRERLIRPAQPAAIDTSSSW